MNWLDRAESSLVEIASKTGPILAPIPTAYLVGASTIKHLDWPLSIGVIASITVECLGLASTGLALTLWDYQKSKRKSDPGAPFELSVALVGAYFIVALALTVALDIVPSLAIYAPALFPALSLAGVSILAIRIGHRERVAEIEQSKAEKKASRNQRASDAPVTRQPIASAPVWRDVAHFLSDDNKPDDLKPPQVVEMAQVSLRTAQRWIRQDKDARAHSDNGRE